MIGIKGNPRRANKDSITIINPREFKRDNFGGFMRKILSDLTDPPDLQAKHVDIVCSPVPSMQAGCQK